jgi:hypothetical protein
VGEKQTSIQTYHLQASPQTSLNVWKLQLTLYHVVLPYLLGHPSHKETM